MRKIGFIGAGKVGIALASYLQLNDYPISGYYSLLYPDHLIGEDDILIFTCMEDLINESDIVFITTPDDVIESISQQIADAHVSLSGKLLLHCSGALSSKVLDACMAKGAKVGTIHPLQAFTGREDDSNNLKFSYLTLEAPTGSRSDLETLINRLGNPHVWIDGDKKALYHGAAVMISNYMVTLLNEGFKYMGSLGIDQPQAFQMMAPLIESTLQNVKAKGTIDGLTGPIVRGDLKVIQSHIKQIDHNLSEQESAFYKTMGRMTLEMIRSKRIDDDTYNRFDQFLRSD